MFVIRQLKNRNLLFEALFWKRVGMFSTAQFASEHALIGPPMLNNLATAGSSLGQDGRWYRPPRSGFILIFLNFFFQIAIRTHNWSFATRWTYQRSHYSNSDAPHLMSASIRGINILFNVRVVTYVAPVNMCSVFLLHVSMLAWLLTNTCLTPATGLIHDVVMHYLSSSQNVWPPPASLFIFVPIAERIGGTGPSVRQWMWPF